MRHAQPVRHMFMLVALGLWVSGCATGNVNPSQARANKGYVDFYADSFEELSWQVERFDDGSKSYKQVFSDLEPQPGRVLRLAFPPGHHRLQIIFLNRFIRETPAVDVEVKDGMITPVHVVLVPDETALVDRKQRVIGPTASGRGGNKTRVISSETVIYRASAEAGAPMAYQVKEQTVYAH